MILLHLAYLDRDILDWYVVKLISKSTKIEADSINHHYKIINQREVEFFDIEIRRTCDYIQQNFELFRYGNGYSNQLEDISSYLKELSL